MKYVQSNISCRDQDRCLIGLEQARSLIREIPFLEQEKVALDRACGRVAARDIRAMSDCPSLDASLKDGYAVFSPDLKGASESSPVALEISGTLTAGQGDGNVLLRPGHAVRIMTGSVLPRGATAVLAAEFAREEENGRRVIALRDAGPGRNVLVRGSDVRAGTVLARAGTRLSPAGVGLLAAGGVAWLDVVRRPRVVIVATCSELVAPGQPIGPGQVAASNMVTLAAELERIGIQTETVIIRDNLEQLARELHPLMERFDVVLTCGGVLDGDKDFTLEAMERLGVETRFRRVRVGPGKGICMGWHRETLVFNLPGGPPSNHVAFLLLALPGILRRMGVADPFARRLHGVTSGLRGQRGWTQVFYGRLREENSQLVARPLAGMSRLQAMAEANCLLELPESCEALEAGETAPVTWIGEAGTLA